MRKLYREVEADLQSLDEQSWLFLRGQLASCTKDSKRGWQSLFDRLNEAKAYRYLVTAGYTDIQFIRPSSAGKRKSPDLKARAGAESVFCEVKTINASDVEAERRWVGGVQTIDDQLDDGFFGKLESDLREAKAQMQTYETQRSTKKIVYVIVNFDDRFHEYADRYQNQIAHYMAERTDTDQDVVFDIKPAFGSA